MTDDPHRTQHVGATPSAAPATPPPGLPPSNAPGGPSTGGADGGGSGPMVFTVLAALVLVAALGFLAWTLSGDGDDTADADTAPIGESTTAASAEQDGLDQNGADQNGADQDGAEQDGADQDGAGDLPLSTEDLARRVVQIQLLLDGTPVCTGSGSIVSSDGLVLTNSHVIAQSAVCPHDTIGVAVVDRADAAPDLAFEADLLADSPELDLAVIRIARATDGSAVPQFPTVPIGAATDVQLGDELRILGFPGIGGETITATTGAVSGFVDTAEGGARSWIKTDATIAGGNSGGLAADADGRIVGIPTQVGAGTGAVVDCRFLADSDGDGDLDGDDSCVPTGGFLNGVRPIEFALPLIEQARTASPLPIGEPRQSDGPSTDQPFAHSAVWALGVDGDGFPVDPIVSGSEATTQVCLTWVYENVPRGAAFDLVWSIDGATGPGDIASGTNQGETNGEFFGCYGNGSAPLPQGRLEARWDIDGDPVFSEAIYVGPNRDVLPLTLRNTTDEPLCVIAATPAGARSFGTNDLFDVLDPGQSVTLDVARGAHDVAVIDCLGQVVLVLEGLAVDESLGPIPVG